MKKVVTVILIVLLALAILGAAGALLFRHFVTDMITDKGGMMNPDYADEADAGNIQDGDYTYVDNEKLLLMITGTWSDEDGHYVIKLDSDCRIVLSLDGEPLLEDNIQFTYLQPGTARSTEISLDSGILHGKDGTAAGEIVSFCHEPSDEDACGRLIMEIELADGSKTVEFKKQEK